MSQRRALFWLSDFRGCSPQVLAWLLLGLWQTSTSWQKHVAEASRLPHGGEEAQTEQKRPGPNISLKAIPPSDLLRSAS